MRCPKCNCSNVPEVKAVDVNWNEVYRKRKCPNCGHTFFTCEFEVIPNKRFRREWNLYKERNFRQYMTAPKGRNNN